MTSFMSRRPRALLPLLAMLTALLLAACGSGSSSNSGAVHPSGKVDGHAVEDLFGTLPSSGSATGTGTITMGQTDGDTPTYIFPIVPSANATDGTNLLVSQLYTPLFNVQVGGDFKINWATSVAEHPTYSDGDRRVTIRLRSDHWSDGRPVTARDVLFDIALLKAAVKQNASDSDVYTPGQFPDNLAAATAQGSRTLVLTFKRAYNPNYIVGDQLDFGLYPMPSSQWNVESAHGPHVSDWSNPAVARKIYDFLNKQAGTLSTLATDPLWKTVDGPFRLTSFSTVNGSYTLTANPRYALDGRVRYHALKVETFTTTTAQLNALRTDALDIGPNIDFSQLGQVPTLRRAGYRVYGYPNIGSFGFIVNFKDRTGHFGSIVSQLYVRQALAHLIDEPAYITGVFKGAASAAYGPLPSVPRTPYTPSTAGTPTYPYSVSAAVGLLKAHGWKVVPNGQSTCEKPGTGNGECGAGIPRGTPFKFTLAATPAGETESIPLESDAFASEAKQAGIAIAIATKTFNFQISNYDDANSADKKYENDWGMANWGEYGTSPYPTGDTIFNTGGSSNFGGYSSPTADRLIAAARYGHSASAATAVNRYLAKDLPMLFLPCADVLDAVSNKIGGTTDSFLSATQDVFYPQFWYLKK